MEVTARAPGKIILAGEHAVVHGSTAVAASINLCTYVSLRFLPHSENNDTLKLQLKDMTLEFSWSIGKIKAVLSGLNCPFPSTPTAISADTLKSIAAIVEEQDIPEAGIGLATGMMAFIWMYCCIQGFKPAEVAITSELPTGSGLGSSAAFCVALSAALLASSDAVSLDMSNQEEWLTFVENELDLVNKWAFQGEKIIHGKPSGIDNTVSTYGNLIKFKCGNLTCIKTNMVLKMLITDTKVGRNTKSLVGGVSERTLRHPDGMGSVFSAIDSISKEFCDIIQSAASDGLSLSEKEEKIKELMEMNQGLLQCMGVSHASIETVLRTTLKYKLASKLTGAGGGGCVLTLLPTFLSGTVIDKVTAELELCGFKCMSAEIGGHGVQVCFGRASSPEIEIMRCSK